MAITAATAHSKVHTLLYNTFDDIPTPVASVYDYHGVADMSLSAITVEPSSMVSLDTDKAIYQAAPVENWAIGLSIHVHVAYFGGVYDADDADTLTDEIISVLWENQDIGDGYRVYDVSAVDFRVEFDDSKTIGCELKVIVRKVESYVS